MAKKIYSMDSGSWLSNDINNGVGRGAIQFEAPAWRGREDRMTIRVVTKEETGSMRPITIRQKGVLINEVPTGTLEFPIQGGSKQLLITTNAAALNALITSDNPVKAYIKAFTTSSGLTIDINDKSLNYGFAGDPGLQDTFQVSIIISMPDNQNGDEAFENITINGVLVKIHQPGKFVPYIELDKDFGQIEADDTHDVLSIESNLDEYIIEIVDCQSKEIVELNIDKNNVLLDSDGNAEFIHVDTTPEDLGWKVRQVL